MKDNLTPKQIKVFLDALEKKVGRELIFFDLDGVVCDFKKLTKSYAEKINLTEEEFINKKLYRQPGFYISLEPTEGAIESIEELKKKYEIRFLSAPSWNSPDSFKEKRLWIEKYFGKWGEKRLDLSFRKDLSMGHYLIDDRTENGAGEFIGEHIHYGKEKFPDWEKIVKYLMSND